MDNKDNKDNKEMDSDSTIEKEDERENKEIRSIVISGGGTTIFPFYGILKQTNLQKDWKIENIKRIYATSAGTVLAIFIALNYEWSILDDFIIKRPWHNVFKIDVSSITSFIYKRGILNIKSIEDTLSPVFLGKDISIHVTLQEFFEITGIDIHFFTTSLDTVQTVDINHTTHPHWQVVEAVYSSSCLPVLFSPFIKDGIWYCDGAASVHYPLDNCIKDGNDPDEIMGLEKKSNSEGEKNQIGEDSNMFDYILFIVSKFVNLLFKKTEIAIKNEYKYIGPPLYLLDIFNVSSNIEERIHLIKVGEEIAIHHK
jgi:predicted acylesterase/phospholipase RssA